MVPLRSNSDELSLEMFNSLQGFRPDWVPSEGNLDVWIIRSMAAQSAELRDIASGALDSIFRWFGPLVGVNPQDETPSTVASTWTMADNAGYTVPAGTQVGIVSSTGAIVPFKTLSDFTVPTGSTVTATGAVSLVSIEAGEDTAGHGGAGVTAQLIDTLAFVSSVTLTGISTGGQDAEDDDAYLDRLSTRLQTLSDRAILPGDFEILSMDNPTVFRALAIDGYNPANSSFGNERMIAIALQGTDGNPVDSATKAAVDAYLQSKREINFVVNVIDPTYTTIDVNFSFTVLTGYDGPSVEAEAEAVVANYLDPKNWGLNPNDSTAWDQKTVVRIYELVTLINNVQGVDYVTSVTQRTGAAAYAASDINLSGAAPLTRPGTINGTRV